MSSPQSASEFLVHSAIKYDQRSPRQWIIAHLLQHKLYIVVFLIGAFGNGALAFAIPALTGIAFNYVIQTPPDLPAIGHIAWLVVLSQVVRAVLQFGRNSMAEALGQSMERDIREELYASLLGKSMT